MVSYCRILFDRVDDADTGVADDDDGDADDDGDDDDDDWSWLMGVSQLIAKSMILIVMWIIILFENATWQPGMAVVASTAPATSPNYFQSARGGGGPPAQRPGRERPDLPALFSLRPAHAPKVRISK